jgi:HEPN domain-containing protein
MLTRTVASGAAETTLRWIRWADADYLGARLLLLNGLLVQGTALANTAIEKYLKAICSHSGMKIPHSHGIVDIYEKVLADKPTNLSLNQDFLNLLEKGYTLRYPDDLQEGFNVALNQAKILAELDRSVLEITQRFVITINGKRIAMVFDEALAKQDHRFLTSNVVLNPGDAARFFASPSHCYEMRVHQGDLFQVIYQSLQVADDRSFSAEGFVPLKPGQHVVAYPPIVDS